MFGTSRAGVKGETGPVSNVCCDEGIARLNAIGMDNTDQTEFAVALQHKIDTKTKPLGALGRIETLAAQIATVQGRLTPVMDLCQLTIFAADHGIASEGVSAFPSEVTRQMVLNFSGGGAASNVFCRTNGLDLRVVNAGVKGDPFELHAVWDRPVAQGTENFLLGPAMTSSQVKQALEIGAELGVDGVWHAVAFGEMGIGNTSAATMIAHKMIGAELETLVGRGTGLDDSGLGHKLDVLTRASARTTAELSAKEVLAEYGGFEIAMMAGAMQSAATEGRIILVDGFIASAAALVACRMTPETRKAMVFAHRSHEPGHRIILDALHADPLLSLDMRLGEGTGAALAWPLLKSAAAMLDEMASFEDAGVSGKL